MTITYSRLHGRTDYETAHHDIMFALHTKVWREYLLPRFDNWNSLEYSKSRTQTWCVLTLLNTGYVHRCHCKWTK